MQTVHDSFPRQGNKQNKPKNQSPREYLSRIETRHM